MVLISISSLNVTVVEVPPENSRPMAQLAGVSTEEYEDFYFRACLVDYDKMGRDMRPVQDLMARTDRVRIDSPGTDISFSIKIGRAHV